MESKSQDIYSTSVPVIQHDDRASGRRMRGRYLDILFSFLVMTIPMLAFSALLLGLIYQYRIVRREFPSENLSFVGRDDEASAVYVRLSATTLITVASWSSTIAPLLVGFSLTLLSYPIARTLLHAGHGNRPDELPTPFQLSLMLRMLTSGGPGSLWHWLTYAVGWGGRRQPQPSVLKRMTMMLCLGTLLRSVASTFSFPLFSNRYIRMILRIPHLVVSVYTSVTRVDHVITDTDICVF